jgi:hypothetical protein
MVEIVRERQFNEEGLSDSLINITKRICIPIDKEEYKRIILDHKEFRKYVDKLIIEHKELFPSTIDKGYTFHDILPESKKLQDIRIRRIGLKSDREIFTVVPSFILPYMVGFTEDVDKPLFLRRFGIPFWALTYVFGRNDMYWYRIENRFGRNSIVGTTVRNSDNLPTDILSDEKQSWENGERIFIATTVANDCILGASVAKDAGTESLTEAYGHFKTEAQNLCPTYEPETVNTDGWTSTQLALKQLFPTVVVILCFLHSFINIRSCCKNMKEHFSEICKRVWDVYHSPNKHEFITKIGELGIWASKTIPIGTGLNAIKKLCSKSDEFVKAYDHPSAHRTSNMLDRLMDFQDRYIYNCKYFHGNRISSEYSVRAWALLYNFHPYCPRVEISSQYQSPAHKLNGFVYHENWLQNLLVSASMGGFRR